MRLTDALKGEHGAMNPLLALIQERSEGSTLQELRVMAACLESVLISHADLEDAILRPPIEEHLPLPAPNPDGTPGPTDHQVIRLLLTGALVATDPEEARRFLLRTIEETHKHFEKEETKIFAISEREVSVQAQEDQGREWARRRGVQLK
ncbi:MAG: hemerythrin domain-containing protein [Bryobacterales bacterium]|nr:hemerythrin domain-containing protein [Bryobacterales bacterium]